MKYLKIILLLGALFQITETILAKDSNTPSFKPNVQPSKKYPAIKPPVPTDVKKHVTKMSKKLESLQKDMVELQKKIN